MRRRLRRAFQSLAQSLALSIVALFAVGAAHAADEVDLILVLMADASGSVDESEYRLQRMGYARAFRDPDVIAAIRGGFRQRIAVALYEWTGPALQVPVVDWSVLSDPAGIVAYADRLEREPRYLYGGGTSVGHAILFGADAIAASGFQAQRKVIDVSGDGSNRRGIAPNIARDRVVAQGYTINGLPILTDEPDLDVYFQSEVVGGFGAFMIPARDFSDFARAVRAKLIREIAGTAGGDHDGRNAVLGFVAAGQRE